MRGHPEKQKSMFSYIDLEKRIASNHPLRSLRVLVDAILASMDEDFEKLYSAQGRPSIPPEYLLKAMLLQILFTIRSERQLVESIDYNLLYRWFVGLGMEDSVWDHASFSKNRDRLFNERIAEVFFTKVKLLAQWAELTSDEHFSVDGTLIESWASYKSFKPKASPESNDPDSPGNTRNPSVDFKGHKRCNDTHESTTDPESRLYKKSEGTAAKLCHMSHILTENRNGLVVGVATTQADGTAEREAGKKLLKKHINTRATVGADKGYDTKDFVATCREHGVTPHVAQKKKHSAIDGRTTSHQGYVMSIKKRKCIEEVFGWLKTVGGLRKTRHRGQEKLAGQAMLCYAAYNLVRIGSLAGWWNARHT